ncbi:sensor histidine kinase [Humibacillus xanthopallidus]|uniref:histidine kinase n=1 Tax=Humibacillus xanthopallidus TaxID=412689 RepID=A0A543I1Y2_9MICO|nr:ATP-binding protein [Humibacillus xanthopallidus]TQM64571.1 sensor histidine kinase regulating citrate/malate metabolism [Humibacillus xanthopallidus]
MKVEFVLVTQRPGRFGRLSLAGQLLVAQMVILLGVLVTVALVSLAQSEATFTRTEGRRVSAIAEQLASTPIVRTEMGPGGVVNVLPAVVQSVVTQYGVTSVTIADSDEIATVSSDPTIDKTRIPLGKPAVGEGASWTGVMEIGGERMLVAQSPLLYTPTSPTESGPLPVGAQLGTVMVAVRMPSAFDRLQGNSSYLPTYLGIALVIGGVGSWLLARRIKRQTLGLEPAEITGLAESREAMLFGLAEGVVALDTNERITLVNNVAQRLLDLPEHAVGMRLDDLSLGPRLRDVLRGVADEGGSGESGSDAGDGSAHVPRDQVVLRRGRVLVMNRMEVSKDGRPLGSVTTLRDRTELADLEREIGSFRSTTELLRAQAHEFANQLHTISGLIQLGEYDEVVGYVDSVSEHRAQLDLAVSRRIRDTAVTALVMAKAAQATERRVELRVSDDTSLGRLAPRDTADVAAVVGNLVDNAIDAAATSEGPDKWVELTIRQDASSLEVSVVDSGPGIAPEVVTEVFTHGFTTKAARAGERGIGLALTRLICQRRGGEVEVENTPRGAKFVARLTVEAMTTTAEDRS